MSRNRMLGLLPLLLIAASCKPGGVEGPSTPMTVTFEPATLNRTGTRLADGTLRCEVDLTIVGHGETDHLVSLRNIEAKFMIAGVTNVPATITPLGWFGVSYLQRGQTAVSRRQPTAPGPFTFVSTLTYADQFGAIKTTTSTVNCTE